MVRSKGPPNYYLLLLKYPGSLILSPRFSDHNLLRGWFLRWWRGHRGKVLSRASAIWAVGRSLYWWKYGSSVSFASNRRHQVCLRSSPRSCSGYANQVSTATIGSLLAPLWPATWTGVAKKVTFRPCSIKAYAKEKILIFEIAIVESSADWSLRRLCGWILVPWNVFLACSYDVYILFG